MRCRTSFLLRLSLQLPSPGRRTALSALFTLQPGDLIYSGTLAGVGPIQRSDVMRGGVENVGEIEIKVS